MAPNIVPRDFFGTIMALVFLGFAAIATYEMRYKTTTLGLGDMMQDIVAASEFKEHGNVPLRQHYTGIAAVDEVLKFLVVAFMSGAGGWDKGIQVQQAHFLFSFLSIVAVQSVEAARPGNSLALVKL